MSAVQGPKGGPSIVPKDSSSLAPTCLPLRSQCTHCGFGGWDLEMQGQAPPRPGRARGPALGRPCSSRGSEGKCWGQGREASEMLFMAIL